MSGAITAFTGAGPANIRSTRGGTRAHRASRRPRLQGDGRRRGDRTTCGTVWRTCRGRCVARRRRALLAGDRSDTFKLTYGGLLVGWSSPDTHRIRFGVRGLAGFGSATLPM